MAQLQIREQARDVDRWDDITGDHEDDLADVLPTLRSPATRIMRDLSVTGRDHQWDTREQQLLRVIDVLHRKHKRAEVIISEHAETTSNPTATQYASKEIVRADFRARLSLHKDLIGIRKRERALDDKVAKMTAQEAALALEKASLDDQRLNVQLLLDRIANHPLAPPNLQKLTERHYLSSMKRNVDADKAQAEKTRRDYEYRLQQLNEDEKHCETIKQLVEGLDTMTTWTEYKKNREGAIREGNIGSRGKKYDDTDIFKSHPSAGVTTSKEEYDTALREAARKGAMIETQRAMLTIAAYHLMFEDKLLPEEEDSRWPWLRDGDTKLVPQHPTVWPQKIGYELQMHLLYQENNVKNSITRRVMRELEVDILQRPTGNLPDAMDSWFHAIDAGAERARTDFYSMGTMGKLPK